MPQLPLTRLPTKLKKTKSYAPPKPQVPQPKDYKVPSKPVYQPQERDSYAAPSPPPHIIYAGHPPIHIYQQPPVHITEAPKPVYTPPKQKKTVYSAPKPAPKPSYRPAKQPKYNNPPKTNYQAKAPSPTYAEPKPSYGPPKYNPPKQPTYK